jgi:pyruvate ferredoxin oxidoreductase gamma subunit
MQISKGGFIYEIRIHGRGGQGVKTTAHILGRAAFLSGYETQDFAIYGAERRGAPVASFCRIDKTRILTRGYIFNPDAVIVLDSTIDGDTVLGGVRKNALVVVNSERPMSKFMGSVFVDATKIALDTIGRPIPNVAILGCFLKKTRLFPIEKLREAIQQVLGGDREMMDILGMMMGWNWKVQRTRRRWDRLREQTLGKEGIVRKKALEQLDLVEDKVKMLEEQNLSRRDRIRTMRDVEMELSNINDLLEHGVAWLRGGISPQNRQQQRK